MFGLMKTPRMNKIFAQPFRQPDLRIAKRCCGWLRPTVLLPH